MVFKRTETLPIEALSCVKPSLTTRLKEELSVDRPAASSKREGAVGFGCLTSRCPPVVALNADGEKKPFWTTVVLLSVWSSTAP